LQHSSTINSSEKRRRKEKHMSFKAKRAALIAQADSLLAKPNFSKEDRSKFESLMSLASAFVGVDEQPAAVTDEKRQATKYFRDLMLGPEIRTYVPLSTSADSQLIAQGFERDIKTLMIADGPLFAGSPLLTNITVQKMGPSKQPVSDDLSSTGFVLVENSGPANSEAELNFSSVLFGSSTFSSGIILVSSSLYEDLEAWTTTEQLVKRTASARLSRVMNITWLTALKTALVANSSAAVANTGGIGASINNADVRELVNAVGAAYRPNAAFIMSPAIQRNIATIVDGNGRPVHRHILDPQPTLQNYPVHIVAAASANDCLFGDFSFAYAKSSAIEIQTMSERFILDGFLGLVLAQRADFKWSVATTSDSPVKHLVFS
jgi:HK97 family phage major capsid protein